VNLTKSLLCGYLGSEEADRPAKEGAIEFPPNQYTTMPFSVGKKLIKKQWN
jgi:hypothetical protein